MSKKNTEKPEEEITEKTDKGTVEKINVAKEPETKPDPQPEVRKTIVNRLPFAVTRKRLVSGLVLLLVVILGFVAGQHYEKSRQNTNTTNRMAARSGRFGGTPGGTGNFGGRTGGRNGGMRGGVFGQVTAVSATSITVKNVRTNADSTLTVSSTTTVTNNGQAATIGDVKVGDNVLVRTDTANTTQAAQIILNPPTRGRGGQSGMGDTPQTPSQTN